jgi:hypothetical protein
MRKLKRRKCDEAFHGKRFEIVREIKLEPDEDGNPRVFYNLFGMPCRRGFVLRNVETGEKIAVGVDLIKVIAHDYGAVELPVRRRGRPPKNPPPLDN